MADFDLAQFRSVLVYMARLHLEIPGLNIMETDAHTTTQHRFDIREWLWPSLVVGVFLLALGIRVLKAISFEFLIDPDIGIVQNMVKHMLEGRDFPVFFYGQPYMGSLEPILSALLCCFFGTTSLVVALGTTLFGVLSLPLIYLWGCSAGGKRAGLLAMIYCSVGSYSFFVFSVVPRGGYMTMLVFGLLTLWLALHISRLLSEGRKVSSLKYIAMGLAAGLGWWSNQLVIPFLATSALLLLPTIRKNYLGILAAALAFLVGSLPWWWWNLTHDWQSVSYFATSAQGWPFLRGLASASDAFCRLFEVQPVSWLKITKLVAILGMVAGFVFLCVRDMLHRANRQLLSGRLAAMLVPVIMICLYARSDYGTPPESRYLLPVFPAVAIMLGASTDWLLRRFRFPFGILLFALVIPKHVYVLPQMFDDTASGRAVWNAVERNAPRIAALCDGVCLGGWEWNWLNFATREVLTVPSMPKERYNPYAIRGELATRPAFVQDFGRVETFVRSTGGSFQQATLADGISITHSLTPPPSDWDYVNASDLVEVRDDQGGDFRSALADRDLGTCWSTSVEPGKPASLTYTFDRAIDPCGVRFLTPDDQGPHRLTIEGQSSTNGPWFTLMPQTPSTSFFWSGPYPKFSGLQYFPEFRFSAPSGGVRRLRLTMDPVETPYYPRLGDILLLQKIPQNDPVFPSIRECETILLEQGVKCLYGPRWFAGFMAARKTNDEITIKAPSVFQCRIDDIPEYDSRNPLPVVIRDTTGFLMDSRDVPGSRAVLDSLRLKWKETPLGSYTLLVVEKPDAESDAANYPALCWTELGCFANDSMSFRKTKAERLYERAMKAGTNRIDLLTQAVQSYPNHQPARQALIAALAAAGRTGEAAAHEAELKNQTIPDVPARVRFPNGAELLGLSFPSRAIKIGDKFPVVYLWKCPPTVKRNVDVFVHFRKTETEFQDDHGLLLDMARHELDYQPFEEVFAERREVVIPPSLQPGDCIGTVRIGLVNRGRRLQPETTLEVESQAALIPVSLTAEP